MADYDLFPAVTQDGDFPDLVRERMAEHFMDTTTPEGASLLAVTTDNARRVASRAVRVEREYARGAYMRGAPVVCVATRTSAMNVGASANTAITFPDEEVDSDGLHLTGSDSSKFNVPAGLGGIWSISAAASMAADTTGAIELRIQRNGAGFLKSTTLHPAPTVTERGKHVAVSVDAVVLNDGDYVEAVIWHGTGNTRQLSSARFEFQRLGDRIGPGGRVLFSGDVKHKGFDRYALVPARQPAERVFIGDDPVLGPRRQVMHVTVTNADNSVTYPRAQFQSPSSLTAGDDIYVGLSIYIPTDIPDLSGSRSPVIHEIYGPPTDGYGPNVLRIRDNKLALEPEQIYADGVPTGAVHSWSMPITNLKGIWIDVVHRIKLSADPAVGLHELWVNAGAGWQQQTLRDPLTSAAVGTTLHLATLRAGVNDRGNNFSSLKLAYTDYTIGELTLLYADHVVTTSYESAKPTSYS